METICILIYQIIHLTCDNINLQSNFPNEFYSVDENTNNKYYIGLKNYGSSINQDITIQNTGSYKLSFNYARNSFIPTPNHEFDFRNSTGKSFIMDTGSDGTDISATFINGATGSSEGIVLDGVDGYVDLTPWEFGGSMTVRRR